MRMYLFIYHIYHTSVYTHFQELFIIMNILIVALLVTLVIVCIVVVIMFVCTDLFPHTTLVQLDVVIDNIGRSLLWCAVMPV